MKKLTVAEMRRRELARFSESYNVNIEDAKRIVNSFYRFCGLEEVLLYRENNERLVNSSYTQELQEKEEKWIERLQSELAKYNLKMIWFGYLPTICEIGTTKTALERFFYN